MKRVVLSLFEPFSVDRDKDKRLATELDALNRTHGAVISDAAKKEGSEGANLIF